MQTIQEKIHKTSQQNIASHISFDGGDGGYGWGEKGISRRAILAYQRGMVTAGQLAKLLGVKVQELRDAFIPCEWHHTGKKFAKTYFYSLERALEIAAIGFQKSTTPAAVIPKTIELVVDEIVKTTKKAQLVELQGRQFWLPDFAVVSRPAKNTFVIKGSFAANEGLI